MKTKTESGRTASVVSADEFIREITLRICGSLEIKESLSSAFEYLKGQFGGPLTFSSILPGPEQKNMPPVAGNNGSLYPINLDEANAVHITRVLKLSEGKIDGSGGAAEMLGINPSTLRSRLDKLGISYRRRGKR